MSARKTKLSRCRTTLGEIFLVLKELSSESASDYGFKFDKGYMVVCYDRRRNTYYEAEVIGFSGVQDIPHLLMAGTVILWQKKIPMYTVMYTGYEDTDEVAENEIISLLKILRKTNEEMGVGVWFLEDADYELLEKYCKQRTGEKMSFRECYGIKALVDPD